MICKHDVLWTRVEYRVVRPKNKAVLFPEICRRKMSPARTVKCVSEYIYLMLKNKQVKKNKNKIKAKIIQKIKKKREYLPKTD